MMESTENEEGLPISFPACTLIDDMKSGQTAVLSGRAGTGKSAVLIQASLGYLFRKKEVLHVCAGQTVQHVRRGYNDMMDALHEKFHWPVTTDSMRYRAERNRHIHSYKGHSISLPKLRKAMSFLKEHTQFHPSAMIIDGVKLNEIDKDTLKEFKNMAAEENLVLWFSALSHRQNPDPPDGCLPTPLDDTEEVWDAVYMLKPNKEDIPLLCLRKNGVTLKQPSRVNSANTEQSSREESADTKPRSLSIDPTTMLILD